MFQLKFEDRKAKLSLSLLIFLSLFSFNSYAQESDLSKEFLEGLPPTVRDQMSDGDNESDAQLEKLFRADTSVTKNKEILSRLRQQLESLEKKIIAENNDQDFTELSRFGDSFFSSIQSSFMPINIPNLGSEYIVDVGDKFSLQLSGQTSEDFELFVQRDGSLVIPEIGKVYVAGQTLQSTDNLVSNLISTTSIGVNYFLTLSELRDIQVLLLGGIVSPGIYTLSGGSNLLTALNVAGGIKKNGSYRKIEIRRGGKVIKTEDLYDIFVFGKFDSSATLRSGDAIFVSPSSTKIPISGGVNNPAIFETLSNESLDDLINFAGGFSEDFTGFNSVMVRRTDLDSKKLLEIPITELKSFELNARDSVVAPSFSNISEHILEVTISGMVTRPGKYFFMEGEKLSNIIDRAGGYKDNAYIYGGALFRKEALEKEKLYAEINYADTINYIVSNIGKPGASPVSSSALEILVEELKSKQFTGRVIANFDTQLLKQNQGNDLILEHGDEIVIPTIQKVVYLFGDFKNPVNLTYDSAFGVKDYIRLAGGLKDSANSQLVVIDPDGKSHIYSSSKFLLGRSSLDIYPGSIIYAPRDVGKLSGILYASTLSPILSSLALSLASLNTINN
jgi:protein involved in polysaccharide export with SLBB domain